MPAWTHLIRFEALEDRRVHLGQLEDTDADIGLDLEKGIPAKAYRISGDAFTGVVTSELLTVLRVLAPVSQEQCNYIRCMGLNYHAHAKEANMQLPKAPILFTKPRTALNDPFPSAIVIPKIAQDGTSDYEAELCVVIGKSGRDIKETDALDHVLGYTVSNDVSSRNLQLLTTQWCFSKGFDASCPIGPVLVAPSALPDPQQLAIKAVHNGQVVQEGNTSDMIFDVRKQISYFSQGSTLEAGTVLLTGTPAGIGFFRQPRVVLQDGDDIRVSISSIGTLVNKVRYE